MSELKKKFFINKDYQFGYNHAMRIALDNERKLQAIITEHESVATLQRKEIRRLRDTIVELKGINADLRLEIDRLQAPIESGDSRLASAIRAYWSDI